MKLPGVILILLTLGVYFPGARAQFYSTGEPPSSIRWMQMSTSRFRVVYPEGLRSDAAKLISELERTSGFTARPFSRPPKLMPVLLHSSSVLSNGYVTWTPRRMELVTTPPQDSYAQDWISQLSLHEYRHVVQISQLCQGFTSALSFITGEIAPGGVSALLPSWLYEGDAVVNETVNSASGRGRVPGFEMPLRTILLENTKLFSYSKAFLGSYKDFVPDQYQYGYPMVSYGMARYGEKVWPDALNYTARNPYLIAPFLFYLIRHYHTDRAGIYKQAMDSVKQLYNKQEEAVTYCKYSSKNIRRSKLYTSYKLPHDLGDGRILVLRSGIGTRNCFVTINHSGKEQNAVTPGTVRGLKSDVYGNSLIWDEITSDPRWGRRDYSEIRLFDLKLHTLRNLTRRSRYFSPDFSPDGKTIAVAETDVSDNNFLTLISSGTGGCLHRIPSPGNKAIQFPEWISRTELAVISVSALGKQIERVDIVTGEWTVILPYTRYDISEPLCFRQFILFRSSYNGIENIYALDMARKRLFQVTFSRFGAFNPSISSDSTELLFADYSGKGYNIAGTPLDTSGWKAIQPSSDPAGMWPGTRTGEVSQYPSATPVSNIQTDTGAYYKGLHLFHFHSWLPFYTPVTGSTNQISSLPIYAGFMLFSQNLLSTLTSSISYHFSNGYSYMTPRIAWRGWYPVIEISGQVGGPVRSLPLPEGAVPGKAASYYEYQVLTYVPLIFNRGRIIRYLTPQIEYEHKSTFYFSDDHVQQGLNYLHFSLYMSRFLRMSGLDLYSRWGQYVLAAYTVTPGDQGLLGSLFTLQAGVYFPGIGAHHHLLLKGGYQKQYPGQYFLPFHPIAFPRGFPVAISGELTTFSVDYALPVLYPDLSFGPVIYIKRLRADLFHDMSYGTNIIEGNVQRFSGSYRSGGIEIVMDLHLGRIIFPLSMGVREGYRYNRDQFFTEFLLNIHTGGL
jgi:hypothetical protein